MLIDVVKKKTRYPNSKTDVSVWQLVPNRNVKKDEIRPNMRTDSNQSNHEQAGYGPS